MSILACSGEGAPIAIYSAELFAMMGFLVQLILVLLTSAIFLRTWLAASTCAWNVGFTVLHPFLTSSARSGDCGSTMMLLTIIWVPLGVFATGKVVRRYLAWSPTDMRSQNTMGT